MSVPIKLKAPGLKIHNKYKLQLLDAKGCLLQEAYAYNQASARRYNMVCLHGTFPGIAQRQTGYQAAYYDMSRGPAGVHLGTGTGDIDVDTRMYLFAEAFDMGISWTRVSEYTFENMHFTASATFPATTSYVGALTEIGLGPTICNTLLSHAMLVDAEGNPIVVNKTSTNILVVTIDIFFTAVRPEQPFGFLYDPAAASSLAGAWRDNAWNTSMDAKLPVPGGKTFYFSPAYAPDAADAKTAKNCTAGLFSISGWNTAVPYDRNTAAAFPYALKALNCISNADSNNFGFAHSIVLPGLGTIPLPNESILPAYNYTGISIGTGDGSIKNWLPDVNEVVSAKVYVDGEISEASFQNFDPTKSPLWNKCIRVEYLNASGVFTTRDVPSFSVNSNQAACIALPMSNMVAAQYINGQPTRQGYAPSLYSSGGGSTLFSLGTNIVYHDAAGITLDHFRCGKMCAWTGVSPSYAYHAQTYILQYSDDGNTWTEAVHTTEAYKTYYFEPITAKYWRITGGIAVGHSSDIADGHAVTPTQEAYKRVGYDQKAIVAGNSAVYDFGKCGINFAEAPAEGAIITMDAVLNLPYKDNNTILVASYEAEVQDPGEAT